MVLLKIAFRNILRNRRRSLMTGAAIAVGAVAILLMGSFFARNILAFQTMTVERTGHLAVFKRGFFDFGRGNPGGYSIGGYRRVMELIASDPEIGPLVNVITPNVRLFGVAGNFDIDASTSFLGEGFVPADRDRMRLWDEYQVTDSLWQALAKQGSAVTDADVTQGVIGQGLARILGLCKPLGLPDCPEPPQAERAAAPAAPAGADLGGLNDLIRQDGDLGQAAIKEQGPRLDLLAATAAGAPNVVTLHVARADFMGMKDLDDIYVGLNLALAQQLLYGRGEHKVTGIVLQLHRTEDLGQVRSRLTSLFKERGLDLEIRDFAELTPMYPQAIAMYVAMFVFIGTIMAVIVLFTVINTMGMSVMERINEIGTSRAIGLRRSGVRRQFIAEGWLLGTMGATAGVLLAMVIALLFNRAGFTWTPPGVAGEVPLQLLTSGLWKLALPTWIALVAIATLAALVPANRAARMAVVDALRHV